MSHVKASGSVRQHKQGNRPGKRLGLKKWGDQVIKTGQIIVRQRGTRYHAGPNVGLGKDHTLFALADGKVKYSVKHGRSFVAVEA